MNQGLDGGGIETVDGAIDQLAQFLPGLALRGHIGRGGLEQTAAVVVGVVLFPLFSLFFPVHIIAAHLIICVVLLLLPLHFLHGLAPLFDHPLSLMRWHVDAQLVRVGREGPAVITAAITTVAIGQFTTRTFRWSSNIGISSRCNNSSRLGRMVRRRHGTCSPARASTLIVVVIVAVTAAATQGRFDHTPASVHIKMRLCRRSRRGPLVAFPGALHAPLHRGTDPRTASGGWVARNAGDAAGRGVGRGGIGSGGRAGFRGIQPTIGAAARTGMLPDNVQALEDGLVQVEVGGVEGRGAVGLSVGPGGCCSRSGGGYRNGGDIAIAGVGFVVGRLVPGVEVDLGGVVVVVFSAAHLGKHEKQAR